MTREDVTGTVYLYHFSRPYKHAKHYLGWTEYPEQRDNVHQKGYVISANLLRVVKAAGIEIGEPIRTWENVTRAEERRLKRHGGSTRHCPHPDCKRIRRQRDQRWPRKRKRSG